LAKDIHISVEVPLVQTHNTIAHKMGPEDRLADQIGN